MKLIVGLGNPGKEFAQTPHNAGFMAIDHIALWLQNQGVQLEAEKVLAHENSLLSEAFLPSGERLAILIKPLTYMNLSGSAVARVMHKYGIKNQEDILVIYDELDIPVGKYKYSPIKNSRTHKGIGSIISTIGKGVHSLRIGVDNRTNHAIPGDVYVLQRFSPDLLAVLQKGIEEAIEVHVKDFLGLV